MVWRGMGGGVWRAGWMSESGGLCGGGGWWEASKILVPKIYLSTVTKYLYLVASHL